MGGSSHPSLVGFIGYIGFIQLQLQLHLQLPIAPITPITPIAFATAHDEHLIDAIVFRSRRKQQNHYFQVNLSPRFTRDDYREPNVYLPPTQLGADLCITPTDTTLGNKAKKYYWGRGLGDVGSGSDGGSGSGSKGGSGSDGRTLGSQNRGHDGTADNNDHNHGHDHFNFIHTNNLLRTNNKNKNNHTPLQIQLPIPMERSTNTNTNQNQKRNLRSEKQPSFWWERYTPDIALLVRNGTCSLEQKARNAMALNEFYVQFTSRPKNNYPDDDAGTGTGTGTDNDNVTDTDTTASSLEYGPRISYLILYDEYRDITTDNDRGSSHDSDSHSHSGSGRGSGSGYYGIGSDSSYPSPLTDLVGKDDIDILYIEIHPQNFLHLFRDMQRNMYYGDGSYDNTNSNSNSNSNKRSSMILNQQSFYPITDAEHNTWSYNVLIRQIEIANHDAHFLLHWKWIYMITAIVLSLPIIRTCIMIYFVDRRIVVRRNERGWVTGLRIERMFLPSNQEDGGSYDFLSAPMMMNGGGNGNGNGGGGGGVLFPLHLKDTLTKEQLEQLPLVKYGVTDLEQAVRKYLYARGVIGSSSDFFVEGDLEEEEVMECEDNDGADAANDNNIHNNCEGNAGGGAMNHDDDNNNSSGNSTNNSNNEVVQNENNERQGPINSEEEEEGGCTINETNNSNSLSNINNDNNTNTDSGGYEHTSVENGGGLSLTPPNEKGENDNDNDIANHSDDESEDENETMELKNSFIKVAYKSCIACSVCICDFTHGEELRLLPRCGHMFHEECLLPWLTERKNSCPLCQTTVVDDAVDDTNSMAVLDDDHIH